MRRAERDHDLFMFVDFFFQRLLIVYRRFVSSAKYSI